MTLQRRHFLALGTGAAAVAAWPSRPRRLQHGPFPRIAGATSRSSGHSSPASSTTRRAWPGLRQNRYRGAARLDPRTRRWVQLLEWIEEVSLTVSRAWHSTAGPVTLYLAVAPIRTSDRRSKGPSCDRRIRPYVRRTIRPSSWMGRTGPIDGRAAGVDPCDGRNLYFGTRNQGLWRGTDRGETPGRVESFPTTGTAGLGLGFVSSTPRQPARAPHEDDLCGNHGPAESLVAQR